MAELIPPLIHRKNTRVIGYVSDYTPEQLQELFSKNKEKLSGSFTENKGTTKETEEDGPHPSAAGAFGWGALHGLTMGYDDELAGILEAGFWDYWKGDEKAVKKYNEVTKRWRDYQRAANRDQFYASFAGNLAGAAAPIIASALFPPAAGATAAARAAMGADVVLGGRAGVAGAQITSKALAAGERAVQSALAEGAERTAAKAAGEAAIKAAASKEAAKFSLGRAAKTGAIYGGIAGSGEGEGFEDTLMSAGFGAGLGGATPFVASGVSKVTPFVTKSLKAALRGPISSAEMAAKAAQMAEKEAFQISDRAFKYVSRTLGDEGVDKLERALKQRGPDSMIIDLHEGLSARAFDAAKKDYDTYSIVKNRLGARQDEIARRVNDGITKVLGPKVNTNDLKQEIINKAQEKAGPLYERAKAMPIAKTAQEKLSLLQKRPAFQKSSGKAMERVLNDVDPKILASKSSPQLDMRLLHKAKEVLDDKINSAAIKGERGYSRELMNVKQELLDVLETSSPEYAKARNLYRSELEIGDAFDLGKKALEKTVDLDMIKSQLAGMGSLERDAFRKGVREQIEYASKNANNPEHSLLSLFNAQNAQEKLQHIYSKDQADQLMKMLRPEVERSKLFAQLPKHMGEVEERGAQQTMGIGKIAFIKAVVKNFLGKFGRKLLGVHKETERDIAALITAREKGDFGLAREKAVELIKKFHEAEKKRLITKEDHTKFINFVGILLNSSIDRTVIN
ncbi:MULTISPECIES: hypothetical protein [Bartonella]|uniref:Uncharacterized protein n=1 Tax=Bartonella rattimassiliensis 15908 TaxID=1094556 RepID=J0QNP2_9HYPH|nr:MULTISPECIES: hypothetical protein [Bartonella]EJF87321.1 hypothetical protein MCY_00445 [Bartonella rattimassiliensis 15908]